MKRAMAQQKIADLLHDGWTVLKVGAYAYKNGTRSSKPGSASAAPRLGQ
jgi:hypothetical protein